MKKLVLVIVLSAALLLMTGVTNARANTAWYNGCITKQYGWGEGATQEHGNDISCFGYGTPITALLSGTVTYAGWTGFGFYEVTWRLDQPWLAAGSQYAYVEDMSGLAAWTGEHVRAGQTIGYSEEWVEFGLTPDWAYGISNWRWGPNSLFLIYEARNGSIGRSVESSPQVRTTTVSSNVYVVQSGDCLFSIAARYHISWQYLYIGNRGVIGGNPNLIYPGERLVV